MLEKIVYIKHSGVKNPNWPEANQLAIYKCGRRFELMALRKADSVRGQGNCSATLPPH